MHLHLHLRLHRPTFNEILDTLLRLRADLKSPTPHLVFPAAAANGGSSPGGAAASGLKIGSINGSGNGSGIHNSQGGALPKLGAGGAMVQVGGRNISLSALLNGKSGLGLGAGLAALETINEDDGHGGNTARLSGDKR